MRSPAVLIVLFLLAAGLATAAAVWLNNRSQTLAWVAPLALAQAQVILLSAALVLVRRWLWLRVALLASAVILWGLLLGEIHTDSPRMFACVLLAAALFTAAWCAGFRFFGWQLTGPGLAPENEAERIGQFSLATMLGATTLIAVFLSLLRAEDFLPDGWLVFEIVLALAVPGCLLLPCVGGRWAMWATWGAITLGFYAVLALWWQRSDGFEQVFVEILAVILTIELLFLGAAVAVLRMAGFSLARPIGAAQRV